MILTTAPVLAHYDPCLHVFPDGKECPVAFVLRTSTTTKRNYSQFEKEVVSLVYGVQTFHQYLYECKFILVTDHQPLTTIFSPKKGIPPLAAAELQRWAVLLSAYSYTIEFKPTFQHANANALSRLLNGK